MREAEHVDGREAQIEAARSVFYEGFVAEAIDTYLRTACVMDATGVRRKGVLAGQDMADWRASYEAPISAEVNGWQVWKCGFWTQGPALLQSVLTLCGADSGLHRRPGLGAGLGAVLDPECDPNSAQFVHLVTEAMKLSFADREAFYGDHPGVPQDALLSPGYLASRSALIGEAASQVKQRPGDVPGFERWAQAARARSERVVEAGGPGIGEPTMAHLNREGDTVHIDVVDRWGNMVSATPSGGWLQSNPVVPGLGVPLNTRAQMFWLEPDGPNVLRPGKRPRTTLSPSLARDPSGARLAFGTPGGDQQDQWQLIFLLRLLRGEANLQAAIDAPLFHTGHLQASFYPRGLRPGHLMIEARFPEAVLKELAARGHQLEISGAWDVGRLTAVRRDSDGLLSAAATPRLMQAYAIGR